MRTAVARKDYSSLFSYLFFFNYRSSALQVQFPNRKVKLLAVFPQADLEMKALHIDSLALARHLLSQHGGHGAAGVGMSEAQLSRLPIWQCYLKMDKIQRLRRNGWVFDNAVETDGLSISVHFAKVVSAEAAADRLETQAKRRKAKNLARRTGNDTFGPRAQAMAEARPGRVYDSNDLANLTAEQKKFLVGVRICPPKAFLHIDNIFAH